MVFADLFDDFHEKAMLATGLSDFGDTRYVEPLKLLLSDLDILPKFNELGYSSLSEQIIGLLIARLRKQHAQTQNPDALNTPIEKPIIITGMGRTGTTVLHRLLTEDPSSQSLPFWLGNAPKPRPPRDQWDEDEDFQMIKKALSNSIFFGETIRDIHPISADKADECRWSLDQTFWSSTFAQTAKIPNYFEWFATADVRYAYEYHKELLSIVANGDTRRWVLKDPSHVFGIDSLLKVFPDACIVQAHREPVDCMKSMANLIWNSRRKHVELGITEEEAAIDCLKTWAVGLIKIENVRRDYPDHFFDVHMNETRSDPIGTMERIFDYFNLPISPESHASWEKQLAIDPSAGHSCSSSPPDYSLSKEMVDAELGPYAERYKLVVENLEKNQPELFNKRNVQ